jgi:hypothetical protein
MTDEFNKGYEAAKQASKEIIDKLTERIIDMEFEIQRANVVCENKDWSANNYVDRSEKRIEALEAALLPFAAIADESTANLADDYMYSDCYPMSAFRAARAALEKKND